MSRSARTFLLAVTSLLLVGAAPATPSIESTNKALVTRFGQAADARDYDTVRSLLAPDFVRHCQATPDVVVTSRDQFIEFLKADAAVFPDSRQTPRHLVAEGDLVAFWLTYEGTQRGQMGPFPPSGKKVRLDVGGVFRVRQGLLAELWITWDNATALSQLGLLPPPPPPGK